MAKHDDVSPLWRVFFVEAEASEAFGAGKWVRLTGSVTVKPGESLAAVTKEVAHDERRTVRLVPSIAA